MKSGRVVLRLKTPQGTTDFEVRKGIQSQSHSEVVHTSASVAESDSKQFEKSQISFLGDLSTKLVVTSNIAEMLAR